MSKGLTDLELLIWRSVFQALPIEFLAVASDVSVALPKNFFFFNMCMATICSIICVSSLVSILVNIVNYQCTDHALFCRVVMMSGEWFLYTIYIGLYSVVELLWLSIPHLIRKFSTQKDTY